MTMMFRIEDKNGVGPYQNYREWREDDHTKDNGHPGPWDDNKLQVRFERHASGDIYKYHFGFKTTKQYKAWFSKSERIKLFKIGYKLVKIEVTEFINGDTQAIGVKI